MRNVDAGHTSLTPGQNTSEGRTAIPLALIGGIVSLVVAALLELTTGKVPDAVIIAAVHGSAFVGGLAILGFSISRGIAKFGDLKQQARIKVLEDQAAAAEAIAEERKQQIIARDLQRKQDREEATKVELQLRRELDAAKKLTKPKT